MSLQKKIVALFLSLGIVFSLGSFAGLSAFIFPAFERFELQSAEQSLTRVRKALDAELYALEVINREYSEWDHTHEYARGLRDSYVDENLDIAYWTNITVHAMLIFDLDDNLLWGMIVDESITRELPIDEEIADPPTPGHAMLQLARSGGGRGLVRARTAPLLISVLPIMTSSGDGPAAGTLVLGRFLGADLVNELGERAGIAARLYAIDDASIDADIRDSLLAPQRDSEPVRWSYTESSATGTQLIRDVLGQPAFVLQIETPRTITAIGWSTIGTALVFFIAATGVFLLGGWLFTRGLIVAPVTRLTRHIKRMRETGDLDRSLETSRNDEIGVLEREFGDLAGSLNAARQDLEAARDQALAVSNAKSDFLAKMSHEIRTPMNGVLGMLELLGDTPLDKAQKRYMHSISQSADSLLKIIDDILDFSRLEAGKLKLDIRPFELGTFVADITDSLSGLANRKGLHLNHIVPDGSPIVVEGDPVRLRQVLTNLLGNAIKFTETGRVLLRVSSEPDAGEFEYITFEVVDTGIGISPRKQRQVFESFTQEDGSTTRRYGGTGLGLSISKQLVEMMNGRIHLDSEPGAGSTFSFRLRMRVDRSGSLDGLESTFTHVYGDLEGRSSNLKPLQGRVLVAEDNAVNQAVAVGMLDAMGVESAVAWDGREALELFRSESFDAILMDCQMPVMDGFQAASAIREIESRTRRHPIRIIAVTANAMAGDMEKCIAAGMNDYLRKPFKGEQLNAALLKVLQPGPVQEPIEDALEPSRLESLFAVDDLPEAIDDNVLEALSALPDAEERQLLNQVIRTYINSSLDLMTRLGEAIDCSDSECIRSAAHALRSSSANVGATRLAELCASMETSTRKSDRATAVTLQRQLREEYHRVIEALKRRIDAAA